MMHAEHQDAEEAKPTQLVCILGGRMDSGTSEAPPSISATSNFHPSTPFIVAACAAVMRRIESWTGPSPVTSMRARHSLRR
jgi:hypothetical protein